MVVLKKLNLYYRVKGSTLMETLVATVLIVVVFMLASMILNNLFSNSFKNNTNEADAHLNELQYLYINGKLEMPYQTNYNQWQINVDSFIENNQDIVEFEAIHSKTKKAVLNQYIEIK